MAKIGICGAGGWGTALAILLCNNGHDITLWSAIEEEVQLLNEYREHRNKLPKVIIPSKIKITASLEETIVNKELVVLAVPSLFIRSTARFMNPLMKKGQVIVNVSKGVEEETLMTMTDILKEEIPIAEIAVLSGPSHAEEVGNNLPTICVVSAYKKHVADYVQNIFINPVFRVYTSSDILGVELGGSFKNVIALAAGIADGLGLGDNIKAALITRGINEITRLGIKMGARSETFYGLTGIGDLIVTCASTHSRNRKAGYLIGQGYTMETAMKEVGMIVEGVYSAKSALKLAEKYSVDTPIIFEVNKVLFENKCARKALQELMTREKKVELINDNWK